MASEHSMRLRASWWSQHQHRERVRKGAEKNGPNNSVRDQELVAQWLADNEPTICPGWGYKRKQFEG